MKYYTLTLHSCYLQAYYNIVRRPSDRGVNGMPFVQRDSSPTQYWLSKLELVGNTGRYNAHLHSMSVRSEGSIQKKRYKKREIFL